ncbi:MAG: DNA polymerase-1 [Candidatus Poriferisodalaceae bacterium]
MAKLLLLDGNSLTYRAFFALPTDMATASGQVTNAVFGFTSMLVNLIRDHQPDGVAVAFDLPTPTFRHKMLPEYKAQREETPDILRQQMGLVREVLEAMKVPAITLEGFEADDVLATLAVQGRDNGDDVIIVTGDRDIYQMVEDPHIRVLYNKRGVSDYALYDEAGIVERTGVTAQIYPQYAALRGDTSDNLPGVPGVGEKTAAKLINKYGGLDGIFEHKDEQTPKLRENLTEFEERARRNFTAMVLVKDCVLELDVTTLRWGDVDVEEVQRIFDFLEFRSLYDRLNEALEGRLPQMDSDGGILEAEITHLETVDVAVAALGALAAATVPIAVTYAVDPTGGIGGLAFVTNAETGDVSWLAGQLLDDSSVAAGLAAVFATNGPGVHVHHAKPLMRMLAPLEIEMPGLDIDTVIAAYLIDPADSRYALGDLLVRYCRCELPIGSSAPEGQLDLGGGEPEDPALPTCREALAVDRLAPALSEQLDNRDLRALYQDIERPLIGVLARMEDVGVGVDVSELTRLRDYLVSEVERLEADIREAAGREFNVNSTKQLREVLFNELGLTPQKKTKTGFSTDAASLEKIRDQHVIVEHLLAYREVEKLRSTYGQGLLEVVKPDGRIHATFNQTVARTGRLSSEDPNLHNIPVRTEQGREFRRAFIPSPGTELLVADYNQIELRVIAHLSEDPGLVGAFDSGRDIHNATASSVFGVEPADVTIEQRSKAKMVSYGLAYGMEAYGLGQRLGVPTGEAAEILDAYFVAFPSVKAFMDNIVAETKERGYTETMFGRRRPIPELNSSNFRIRQAAERQAMNAPIQGLAADIFKVALVALDKALRDQDAESILVLQVHDEVILEVPASEREEIEKLTVATMMEAAQLRVPLEVNVAYGATWADAKG